jgi:hypothetical protein
LRKRQEARDQWGQPSEIRVGKGGRWMGMHHALAGRLQEEDLRALPEQSTR